MFKKGKHSYGGRYWGIGGKWLWFWLSDYRDNRIVRHNWQIEAGSRLIGNKVIAHW